MSDSRYQLFTEAYQHGRTPWDTGVSPPELVAAIEGAEPLPPGQALDLGCGTGTNCLYLARHGWQVVGLDFVDQAIAIARERLAQVVDDGKVLPGAVRFLRGDATQLETLGLQGRFTLFLDMGCLHGITKERRPLYAHGLTRLAAPHALYLLYGFLPQESENGPTGISPEEVHTLFANAFRREHVEVSTDQGGRASAWYWLRHKAE
jgi:SAM-dependent methyltransferase